jgi:hypothetical protein
MAIPYLKGECELSDLLAFIRKHPHYELPFFKGLITTEAELSSTFLEKNNFLENMKLYHQERTYHAGITEKFMTAAFSQLSRF